MVAVGDVDELGGDPEPVAGLADAALEDGLHVELFPDLADVLFGTLELERRGAGGDAQVLDPAQPVDELLGDPFAEVVLVLVGAHVDEGQDGN